MEIENKIKELGQRLRGNLPDDVLNDALSYIDHSEIVLAFETLCDHIADYEVNISNEDYDLILSIAKFLNLEIDSRYTYIRPSAYTHK
ncbi:hypothetical protein CQ054_17975 [Ochrobactrum sp. MYb29]|nr:hypothetical protein CQ054_17975 [Ochrobactrum sp. MYb29]